MLVFVRVMLYHVRARVCMVCLLQAPTKETVKKFVTQSTTLDPNLVCALLEEKLDMPNPDADSWKFTLVR